MAANAVPFEAIDATQTRLPYDKGRPCRALPKLGLLCPRFTHYGLQNTEVSMIAEAPDPAMTVRDVAGYLNVDEKTVYRLAKRGDLPGFKVAGAWRFKPSDINKWIDLQKEAAQKN